MVKPARSQTSPTSGAVAELVPTPRSRTGGSDSDSSGPPGHPAKKKKDVETTDDVDLAPAEGIGGVPTPTQVPSEVEEEEEEAEKGKLDTIIAMLSKLQGRVDHHGASISTLTSTVTSMQSSFSGQLANIQQKAADEKKEIDGKLAQLQKMLATPASLPTASASQMTSPKAIACAAAASGISADVVAAPSSAAQPSRATRSTSAPAGSRSRGDNDQFKILALGFPRDIPRTAHIKFYDSIVELSGTLLKNTTCLAGNGKAHSILFNTAAEKRAFMQWYRNNKHTIGWIDPRTKENAAIYYKDLKEPAEAARGKALSPYYALVEKHMKMPSAAKWFPEAADLIADTRKGRLMIRTELDLWIFANIVDDKVVPVLDVFQSFGIPAASVEQVASEETV
jgi:hypothetical protein